MDEFGNVDTNVNHEVIPHFVKADTMYPPTIIMINLIEISIQLDVYGGALG